MDKPRVNIFITCLTDLFYPEIGERLVSLLERLGCEVAFPEDQTCCGQPALNSGYPDAAVGLADNFLDVFGAVEGPIVAPFGSCVHMVRHQYPELYRDRPQSAERARELAERTYDFCTFVVDVLGHSEVGGRYPGDQDAPVPVSDGVSDPEGERVPVAYHDECHMLHGLGARTQPHQLLRGVEGIEVIELEGDELCCGFGGTFSMKLPDISTAMADEKIDRYRAAGAEAIVSTDVGCLMHLEGRIRRRGDDIRVLHLLELLEPDGHL